MKKHILFLLLIFCFSFLNAQILEVRLSGGIGISDSKFKMPTLENRSDHKYDQSLYNTLIYLEANYFLLNAKRMSLYLGTGIGFQKNNFYQNMIDKEYGYLLESVKFSENYVSIPLNMGLELATTKYFKLGLQYGLNYDIPLKTENEISNYHEKRYRFIDYNYTLNQKMETKLNHNISIYSKILLTQSLSFIFDIGYNIRENGIYNYVFEHEVFSTNQDTGITTNNTYNYENSLEDIKHNFVTFKIGVSKILF